MRYDGVINCAFVVMEVACGEYGDIVPPLVVAVQNNKCVQFQCHQKVTNCDKLSSPHVASVPATATMVDHNTLSELDRLDLSNEHSSDIRETAILSDDNDDDDVDEIISAAAAAAESDDSAANCLALLHNSCRRAVPTLVLANGDISCDVTLLKEVSFSPLNWKNNLFQCSSWSVALLCYKEF